MEKFMYKPDVKSRFRSSLFYDAEDINADRHPIGRSPMFEEILPRAAVRVVAEAAIPLKQGLKLSCRWTKMI